MEERYGEGEGEERNALLVLTFWTFFYFGRYIFILPLLVLNQLTHDI